MTFYVMHDLSFDVTFEESLKMMKREHALKKVIKKE